MQYLLGIMMFVTALFLILLVLIQRGRGGGLAGAFGGAGGQSAFGTKAGDMFTKITIGTAFVWILIAAMSVRLLNQPKSSVLGDGSSLPTVISPLGALEDDADGAGLLGDGLDDAGLPGTLGTGTDAVDPDAVDPDADTAPPAAFDTPAAGDTPADDEPATNDAPAAATEPAATEAPSTTPPPADPAPGE